MRNAPRRETKERFVDHPGKGFSIEMIPETILDAALAYEKMGWSVIPCLDRSKEAAVRWKRYQENRPTPKLLNRWLRKFNNVAIICGDISGGLVVRDFDTADEYEDWKASHSKLASVLPTAKTSRGCHVYARCSPSPRTTDVANGEIRATGGYVLAPPSIHPSGCRYKWIIEPKKPPPIIEVGEFEVSMLHSQHSQHRSSQSAQVIAVNAGQHNVVLGNSNSFEAVVALCIPTAAGERNKRLFELARRVKALEPNPSMEMLTRIFDQWWSYAEPRIGTKDYGISLNDFLRGFESAKKPYGAKMQEMLEQAIRAGHPVWVPAGCSERCKLLAALCRELQRTNRGAPFFLSTHLAGELLQEEAMTIWRWLTLFQRLHGIQKISTGKFKSRVASEFKYIANDL